MSRTLTIKNVFGIVILSVLSALVVGTIIASVGIVYLPENDNNITNFLALFIGQGFMVIPLLLFLTARKESFVDRLRIRKLPFPVILSTLVLSLGIIILVDEFDRIASLLFTPPEYLDQLGYMLKFDSFNMAVFLMFGIVYWHHWVKKYYSGVFSRNSLKNIGRMSPGLFWSQVFFLPYSLKPILVNSNLYAWRYTGVSGLADGVYLGRFYPSCGE